MDDDLMRELAKIRREELGAPPPSPELSEAERERVLASVLDRLDAGAQAAVNEVPAAPPANVSSIVSRRWLWAGAAALAAALALLVFRPSTGPQELPSYAITRAHGDASVRSDSSSTQRLELDDPRGRIDVVVTPATSVTMPIDVALVAHPAQGSVVVVDVTSLVERTESGTIRVLGPLDRFIALSPGRWDLEVVVSPKGSGPRSAQEVDERRAKGGWRTSTLELTIAEP